MKSLESLLVAIFLFIIFGLPLLLSIGALTILAGVELNILAPEFPGEIELYVNSIKGIIPPIYFLLLGINGFSILILLCNKKGGMGDEFL